jgi:hypothetical protein
MELTEQQAQELLNKAKEPKVLKEIKLREGEEDIRDLDRKDVIQLDYRLKSDYWQYLAALNQTLITLTLVAMEIAKKMDIPIEKIIDESVKK